MTPQQLAKLPIGTIVHSPAQGGSCCEDVLAGHADPRTGRLATFAPLWGGGGSQTIRGFVLPLLHLPEECWHSARRVA